MVSKNLVIIIVLGIAILGIGGFFIVSRDTSEPVVIEKEGFAREEEAENKKMMTGDESGSVMKDKMEEEIRIDAENYKFSVKEIRVKKGAKVKVKLTSVQGFHDFVVDEFNAKTEKVSEGESAVVEFVADKTGTFEYYCSVGNHRELGMVGKLIVNE